MPSWKKLIVSGSDASLSSLTTTGKLQLNSSETGSTIFEVNGINGRLFTITDEMSGSLFNISTTAGLPVIEALSANHIESIIQSLRNDGFLVSEIREKS